MQPSVRPSVGPLLSAVSHESCLHGGDVVAVDVALQADHGGGRPSVDEALVEHVVYTLHLAPPAPLACSQVAKATSLNLFNPHNYSFQATPAVTGHAHATC